MLEISFLVLHLLPGREKIMTVPRKTKKREARREEKAEKAAILDKVLFPVLFYFSDYPDCPLHLLILVISCRVLRKNCLSA